MKIRTRNLKARMRFTAENIAGRPPFDEFDSEAEDIESYLERLQEYFTAYDIKKDEANAAKERGE